MTDRRKKNKPPAVRGRRGHSRISREQGLSEYIDAMLLEVPRPTYEEMAERIRTSGWRDVSTSAIQRYGMKFEIRRREMRLLLEQASLLASDSNPESVLDLERAIANLANTKIYKNLLDPVNEIDEATREIMTVASRLQSSSSSRERARLAYSRAVKTAVTMIKAEMERVLKRKPEALKIVLRAIDEVETVASEPAR